MIYRAIFKLFLQRIPPEAAHTLASGALRVLAAGARIRTILRRLTLPEDESLRVRTLGLTFPSPLGVAAGVDKDVNLFESLGAIGFGFVEVGTVTALPQKGNPRPTIRRLPQDRALLNRMGSPNPGAHAAAQRLRKRSGLTIVGTNIGKSRGTPVEAAGDDYRATAREVAPFSDFIVINVSSPNTPGLRELQATELLGPLVRDVLDETRSMRNPVPVLIKVSPDLSDEELDAIAALAMELELDGIVAINTTVQRTGLTASRIGGFEQGGVSGPPLQARALEVLQRLYARVGSSLVLVSVGGIETPEDAWERILAGATLLQAHTGFIYGGPAWPRHMNRALVRRVRKAGVSSIQELVGVAARGNQPGEARRTAALATPAPSLRG